MMGLSGCHHANPRVATTSSTAPSLPAPPPAPATIPHNLKVFSTEVGLASWYGRSGRRAANGQPFDQDALTAASRTIPLNSLARITNLATGQSAVVRITDRGPFVPGRILDLSMGAAKATGVFRMGIAKVKVEAYNSDGVSPGPGHWCVQIGAFVDPDDALQMKNDLLRRYGTSVKVITFKGDTGSWVRLTPLIPDKNKADMVAAQVRVPDPGVVAYVTRTN